MGQDYSTTQGSGEATALSSAPLYLNLSLLQWKLNLNLLFVKLITGAKWWLNNDS